MMVQEKSRVVVWFSCGVTSAVTAKLAVTELSVSNELCVVYCDTGAEHPSNAIFLKDVERWIKHPITILKNDKYTDHFDLFEKRKYIVGVHGAPCTILLKKELREKYQEADDIHIFGYSIEERGRADRLRANMPELTLAFNLIDKGLSKADCMALVEQAGIALPEMYKLGYGHNNCVGCPKGQMGYWNKIRIDFPDVFEKMAVLERKLGAAICKSYAGDGKRRRVFLDELDPQAGRPEHITEAGCSLFCEIVNNEISGG